MDKLDAILIGSGINDRLSITKIHYALEILKNEAIKLVILSVLFFFLGNIMGFVFAIILLLPVRLFSGGMHMKSNIGCFAYSIVFFVFSIEILPLVMIATSTLFLLLGISAAIIIILSPVASHKRPINTIERQLSMKKKCVLFLSIGITAILVLYALNHQRFFVIGVWVITLQALQLLITWAYRKRKE